VVDYSLTLTVCMHTVRGVAGIERVTRQLVALLFVLLEAYLHEEDLHGYAIMKKAHLNGPSTYRNLDRLEDARLVEVRAEELPPGDDRPHRIYYRLNAEGAATARAIIAERRPDLLQSLGRAPSAPRPRPGFGTLYAVFPGHAGGIR
jgi:PadR family transcriptional regulator, regulatory protein PadR